MSFKDWILDVLGFETGEKTKRAVENNQSEAHFEAAPLKRAALPMTDEEKQRVAVMAATIIGSQKPDMRLHITNITRIE